MKYVITIIFGLLIGHSLSLVHNWISSHYVARDYGTGPYIENLEIGCYNRFPMGKKCTDSIVKRQYCDLDKLSQAVAQHETAGCTRGTGRVNNCHGMLIRINGKRVPIVYSSPEESHKAFKKLWVKRYGGCPDIAKAIKYSGSDRPQEWLYNVNLFLGNTQNSEK